MLWKNFENIKQKTILEIRTLVDWSKKWKNQSKQKRI